MSTFTPLLAAALEAVNIASDLVRDHEPRTLHAKGDRDFASDVDFMVESAVRSFLAQKTPHIGFLGEEEGRTNAEGELLWALDPIDGTVNFVRGLPLCAVSLGLVHSNRAVLGVIKLPFLGSCYHAVDGEGAFHGTRKLEVSGIANLNDAVIAMGDYAVGTGSQEKNRLRLALTEDLAGQALRMRMLGTAATDLAWLADGKVDASVTMSNNPWDTSAGVVIAREAGAVVVDRDGSPHTFDSQATIAGSAAIVAQIIESIRRAESRVWPEGAVL
ncbi:inositol monophosphatase family protein [Longispora fulva]|uniref:Myo-inositol-1(Or 4)-monophosphatase n=1 Tax=Longispora fulva TaxID=619741 RepID=A0A8J7G7Q6_9ACTN|nr:inositol monophosphatase family protein [Longispora fulva]MBG6134615.1 myo-inositol-1(or 4)-monophosphatase [Longispora fulva]